MYYVYEWHRADLNLPYYIGKGKENRAYDLKRDNNYTNTVTSYLIKNGIRRDVRIIANFATEDAAFEYEKERIEYWWYLKDHDILTNQNIGGKAPPTHYGDVNPAKRSEVRSVLRSQKVGSNNHRFGKKCTKEENIKRSSSVSKSRLNESEEKKRVRQQRIWETRRKNGTDKGIKAHNRTPVLICGTRFDTITGFCKSAKTSFSRVKKLIANNDVEKLQELLNRTKQVPL